MPLYDFECPHKHRFERMCPMGERNEEVPCEGTVNDVLGDGEVPCMLKAKIFVGTHSNPSAILDHGGASNRDAAREGRYDPLNPNRRFMSKGRKWRK